MENYAGYFVTRVNYDADGVPTDVIIEKQNPNKQSNLPLDSKTVNFVDFLRELAGLENIVDSAKMIREQVHSKVRKSISGEFHAVNEARYIAKNQKA
ncbi:hypothetical protein HYW75_00915 [Candidatus Pacearchaeota archaeon]|nr:hypothetical protein [Candidatus Pacearchaeota archaeon]